MKRTKKAGNNITENKAEKVASELARQVGWVVVQRGCVVAQSH